MGTKDRISYLFLRYLDNCTSPAEIRELLAFFNTENENTLMLQIVALLDQAPAQELAMDDAAVLEKVFLKVSKRINQQKPVQLYAFAKWLKYTAAATVLLVAGLGWVYYAKSQKVEPKLAKHEPLDIWPGSKAAVLTLANGKRIELKTRSKGHIAQEGGIAINKTAEGQVVYTLLDNGETDEHAVNTIEIPKGGQVQSLWLPDGSKVWLNAASKLVYPVSFARQKERRVELSGEAYFEVAKLTSVNSVSDGQSGKKVPFIVRVTPTANSSRVQEVEVLGTHFNINGYRQQEIKTTLLEGSVRVSAYDLVAGTMLKGNTVMIKPGEEAVQRGEKMLVAQADTEQAVAWKNEWFDFKSNTLNEVLDRVANCYDFVVVYKGKMPTDRFTGKIPMNVKLSQFMRMLELSGVKFKLEGKTMIISQD